MVLRLSSRMTSPADIRLLAMNGLQIKKHIVDKHLNNERDISEAAFRVLDEWCKNQLNSRVAHSRLCRVLRLVDMSAFIKHLQEYKIEDTEDVIEGRKDPSNEQILPGHKVLAQNVSQIDNENIVSVSEQERWLSLFRKNSQMIGMLCTGTFIAVCMYKYGHVFLKSSK